MEINIQLLDLLEQLLKEGKKLEVYPPINTIQVYEDEIAIKRIYKVNEATMLKLLTRNIQNATVDGSWFYIESQNTK